MAAIKFCQADTQPPFVFTLLSNFMSSGRNTTVLRFYGCCQILCRQVDTQPPLVSMAVKFNVVRLILYRFWLLCLLSNFMASGRYSTALGFHCCCQRLFRPADTLPPFISIVAVKFYVVRELLYRSLLV